MIGFTTVFYTGSLALTFILNVIGAAFGQLRISQAILKAHDTQPQAHQALTKTGVIAMAISETACILALTIIIILFFRTNQASEQFIFASIAQSSIIAALGISGCIVSFCSSLPAVQAAYAIAQQPFFANKILNVMLITMSIIQTAAIFGFIILLLISFQTGALETINDALRLFAAGLCVGLGSIGPIIGQSLFARSACYVVGINRKAYARVLTFAILSQTLIETPIIIALLVALLLLNSPTPSNLKIIALIMAAVCQSISNFTPGISSGRTASAACKQIAIAEVDSAGITRTCLLAQGLIDTFAVYGLLISVLLILRPV